MSHEPVLLSTISTSSRLSALNLSLPSPPKSYIASCSSQHAWNLSKNGGFIPNTPQPFTPARQKAPFKFLISVHTFMNYENSPLVSSPLLWRGWGRQLFTVLIFQDNLLYSRTFPPLPPSAMLSRLFCAAR